MSDMILMDARDADQRFTIASWVVAPRPIAWITTKDATGNDNLAPFSFFTIASTDPLVFAITIEPRRNGLPKDTLANILANKEFVIHIAGPEWVTAVAASGEDSPPEFDELKQLELLTTQAVQVSPLVIAGTNAVFECHLLTTLSFGHETIVFGRAAATHVAARLLDQDGAMSPRTMNHLGRVGSGFVSTTTLTP